MTGSDNGLMPHRCLDLYLRCIRNMSMSDFHLDPATQMQRTAMQRVDVFGWQKMNHEHYECTDPYENYMLCHPPGVIVKCVLKITTRATFQSKRKKMIRIQIQSWRISYFRYNSFQSGHYRKTSKISHTLVGNKIVDNSDVVGASPVGAAPTTSSFST